MNLEMSAICAEFWRNFKKFQWASPYRMIDLVRFGIAGKVDLLFFGPQLGTPFAATRSYPHTCKM